MKCIHLAGLAWMLALSLMAHPRDSRATFELLNKGKALSAQDADKLEQRLKKKPEDEEARIELLAYYSAPPAGVDFSAVKAARSRLIRWLIANDPKEGMGLFQVATGVYRLHCQGDDLADPDGFKRAGDMWAEQLKRNPRDTRIRRQTVDFIQFCSPEEAERILIDANDEAGLGRLYASAVLGISGQSYQNGEPAGSDPAIRRRPFAEKAQHLLELATDKDLLVAAAIALLRDGAILYADGKLDWDYTALGNSVLTKAKGLAPDAMTLLTLPTTLPSRGERPPLTIRVGGNVQLANLTRKVAPTYPPAAREAGIQGTVQMTALIGLDGKVLFLHADSGPSELVTTSIDAVRQWEYKPSLLDGRPCYVITRIDVNYTLSQ